MILDLLLIATTNPGKLREVIALLGDLPIRHETLADHPQVPVAVEDADTFEGNAEIKALHYARATGRWTLADDSGLEVDALQGAPGVFSARYAGEGCGDAANNGKLLRELEARPLERRTARFRCAVALAGPQGPVATATGTLEGFILDAPRGTNGFGYDPLFFVPELGKALAEIEPDMKNRISHRGRALRIIRTQIERLTSPAA